jgi:vitamin B12 transporter
MPVLSVISVAVPLLLPNGAGAADPVAAFSAATTLTPLIVSATRILTPESEIGSSVTLITGGAIEQKQERTLPEVLQEVPGLNVVQTGGPGGTTSVFMRGTNSNHTKVLIDGIDVGNPGAPNGAFDFAHILTWDIDRVEVLRGPQSGLYGSDAIGGVIDIITKTGSGPPRFIGILEGGSFGTFNQTALASGSLERFHTPLTSSISTQRTRR